MVDVVVFCHANWVCKPLSLSLFFVLFWLYVVVVCLFCFVFVVCLFLTAGFGYCKVVKSRPTVSYIRRMVLS